MWKPLRHHLPAAGDPRPFKTSLAIYKLARPHAFPGGKEAFSTLGVNHVFSGAGKVRGPQIKRGECGVAERGPRQGWEVIKLRGCVGPGPQGTDCKAPERQAVGQAGNTEGCSNSRRRPAKLGRQH